jgi:hypothetical protein
MAIGNGIIYTTTTEHTVEMPIYKGALQRAINATNGQELWTLNDCTSEAGAPSAALETGAIADGFSVTLNGYDNQIYCVGRGPSTTSIEAPKAAIDFGRSLIISGTVTDISAGAKQDEQSVRFSNGVPVASDASMSDWMGYVYQQKPLPTSFTGVKVSIDVVDSNGNLRNIGTATTSSDGTYSLQWKPDIEGKYTVYANFAGSNGYWPSHASTSFAVDPAAATPAPTATPIQSAADMYFVPAIAGLFVLVIVVAIVLALLMLRKHP